LIDDMSNLWDLSHLKPREDVVVEGDTLSAMFWNAAAPRAGRVFMRQ
jgi:long-chain acyl-CoA synthetase